jgi:sulfoxide reductase heme-binding subunit YedZ
MSRLRALKVVVFLACLEPVAELSWKALHGGLGANPIEVITRSTGSWTLALLLVTLSVSPLRKLTGWLELIRLRRMLGLYAFFYGCLHFLTYIWLDKFFALHEILKDVYKRPFITAGFTAFVLLIPLAVTSTQGMIRRLGGKRWRWLHRLIYVSAAAGVVHYLWLVKADIRVPLIYACLLGVLMSYRLVAWTASRLGRRPSAAAARPRAPRRNVSAGGISP